MLLVAVALLLVVTLHWSLYSSQATELGKAAGLTQLVAIFLPILCGGVDAFFRDLATRRQGDKPRPLATALAIAGRALLLSIIAIGSLSLMVRTWSAFFLGVEGQELADAAHTFFVVANSGRGTYRVGLLEHTFRRL
jgi:peptidoglycan/LPS O-acetylase OafA/YrhL